MNLFLLLTAMLSSLTGVGRVIDARARAGVEASQVVAAVQAVAPAAARRQVSRPDGYVAPLPLILDLTRARDALRPVAPERRRE